MGLEEALCTHPVPPQTEEESVEALRAALGSVEAGTVAVVCHWGTINALSGFGPGNCDLVECTRCPDSGRISQVRVHSAPRAPKTNNVRQGKKKS